MSKETTKIPAAKQADAKQPIELNDGNLDAVRGAYSREDWVLILEAMERQKDGC